MTSQRTVPAIDDALRFVQMTGIFYCPSELTEPWGLTMPPMPDCVWFHAVTSGTCHVLVEGEPESAARVARAGDLVLVPHGTGHQAWGRQQAPTPIVYDLPHNYVGEHYAVLRHGGGGDRTTVVCGGIRFEHPAARHLIDALPSVIHIGADRAPRGDWMQSTLELMAEEAQHAHLGGEAIISRLCDIVVIQAIRSWVERDAANHSGWLAASHDEQIGKAIALIHAEPERDWTVASLADAVAMSRSAFAARFTDLVGESAMRYVTRWRMLIAADHLRSDEISVAAVAARVGYDSEAAFSRAFKRVLGISPSAAKRSTPSVSLAG